MSGTIMGISVSVAVARAACLLAGLLTWLYSYKLQAGIDAVWEWLSNSAFYRSVVFETVYTVLLGTVITVVFWAMERVPFILRAYTHRKLPVKLPNRAEVAVMVGRHFLLFMSLDFITPKKYGHVDPAIYKQRQGYVHLTRLLPERAPTLGGLLTESFFALVIYDALFFGFHVLVHKVPYLWKTVHKPHHDQTELNASETVHLHPLEHLMLVVPGNEALRLVGAHPLSRTLFNTWLIYFLFANHSAMDIPLSVDKLVPFGLMHGPKEHEVHHIKNLTKYYAPVFSYLDWLLEWSEKRWREQKA